MTSMITDAVILVVGASSCLVVRTVKRPEVFAVVHTAVMTAGALTLLGHLVHGSVTSSGRRQGGCIGESVIIGCLAAGMLFGTPRLAERVRQRRRT